MPEEEEEEGGRPPRERDQQQQQQPPPPRRRPSFPAGEAAGVSGGKRARAPGGEGAAAKRRKRCDLGNGGGSAAGQPAEERDGTMAAVLELLRDPVLSDLPEIPTAEEVDTLIALESGSAYRVTVERGGLPPLLLVARQNATLRDLKSLIRLKVQRAEEQKTPPRVPYKISWKYIWKTYCLALNGYPLVDDTAKLVDAGMRNNSVVTFLKAYPVRKKERPERPAKRKREARG